MIIVTQNLFAERIQQSKIALDKTISTVESVAIILDGELSEASVNTVARILGGHAVGLVSVWGTQSKQLENLIDRYSIENRSEGPLTTSEGCDEPVEDFLRTVVFVYRGSLPLESQEKPLLLLYMSASHAMPPSLLAYAKRLESDSNRKNADLFISED